MTVDPPTDRYWLLAARTTTAIALLVTLAACGQENRYVAPPPPKVTVAPPAQQKFTRDVEATGYAAAINTTNVGTAAEAANPAMACATSTRYILCARAIIAIAPANTAHIVRNTFLDPNICPNLAPSMTKAATHRECTTITVPTVVAGT